MFPLEHSAILLTCIKLKSVLKTIIGLLFEIVNSIILEQIRIIEFCLSDHYHKLHSCVWHMGSYFPKTYTRGKAVKRLKSVLNLTYVYLLRSS